MKNSLAILLGVFASGCGDRSEKLLNRLVREVTNQYSPAQLTHFADECHSRYATNGGFVSGFVSGTNWPSWLSSSSLTPNSVFVSASSNKNVILEFDGGFSHRGILIGNPPFTGRSEWWHWTNNVWIYSGP